jgi:hypothetical protein
MRVCVVEPGCDDRARHLRRVRSRAAARVARWASAGVRDVRDAAHSRDLRSRSRDPRIRRQRQRRIEGLESDRTRRFLSWPHTAHPHCRGARVVCRPAGRMRSDRAQPLGTLRERGRFRPGQAAPDGVGCRAGVRAGTGEVAGGARACPRHSRCRVRCVGLAPADARRTAAIIQHQRARGGRPVAGTAGRRHSDQSRLFQDDGYSRGQRAGVY